jgi:peptidoglycan/xylan/chitin deacetylase (PgdA/CDA1 family)
MKSRWTQRQRRPNEIPILLYHQLEQDNPATTPYSISVRQFESQLDMLQQGGFTAINFRGLSETMKIGGAFARKPVWITFDDGYASFRNHALPALHRRRMTATAFLVAGEIGGFNRWDSDNGIPRQPLMDQAAIEEVIAAGFEIGSHGWAHRNLLTCSRKELEEEVVRSRQRLYAQFGVATTTFAYPYGRYSELHYEMLAGAGYRAAVTSSTGIPNSTDGRFAMRRICVYGWDTRFRFLLKLSPLYLRCKSIRWLASLVSPMTH